jgi:two-component sensor histidine kinase
VTFESEIIQGFGAVRKLSRAPWWAGALFAVGVVVASAAARENLGGVLHEDPYLLFFPPIILSSSLFGRGTGFVALVLSLLAVAWIVPPPQSFRIEQAHVLSVILFGLVAFICAAAIELLQLAVAMTLDRDERLQAAEASEARKSMLLSESAHRIRNDLGVLSSLLSLQSRRRPDASDALDAAAAQLKVLGRLHSRFSEDGGPATVRSDEFLREFVEDWEGVHFADRSIRLVLSAEPAELPLNTAKTFCLIANELITNAAKYAFPEGRGVIEISFRREVDRDTLTVADDGVGLAEETQGTGLGTELIRRLAAYTGGEFTRKQRVGRPGTIGTVTLPVPPPPEPESSDRAA